ncbi:MAG: amino acid adenylation domain-containing protein [Vicinamibacterales bacterium]
MIVLKRLSDAQRDGDRVRAVIRGSAVNQDGASGGLTVPNGRAQQRVITEALAQAGVAPGTVSYLEAHGTGTSLGDPIEVQAAAAVLGAGRPADRPLLLGSVKTNIGHLEASAGIAGVIKVVLALEHERLPQHLHFTTPSPHIPWSRLPVEVLRQARPWPAAGGERTAGVSSFGFSGTNAHLVLGEAPEQASAAVAGSAGQPDGTQTTVTAARRYHLLPLSARTADALQATVANYTAWVTSHPAAEIADVCHTAAVGRSHLEHRAALVVDTTERSRRMLGALADERPVPGVFTGICTDPPKTAWLFTGQGSQYAGMGRELYDIHPVFRAALDHCDAVLRDRLERPLLEVMFEDAAHLAHTSYAQPALFALEMALARLWQSWGLEPDVVVGHSVGQYAAACVAGVFTLDEGLVLLAERGRLFGELPVGGRMAAVFADARKVDERVAAYRGLAVAAYNGAHVVISGVRADVEALVDSFTHKGVRCELLDTSHAFHSALLDPALDPFEQTAQPIIFQPVQRTLICNRTGKVVSGQTVLDAGYWRRHARQPVQFADSVQTLAQLGCKVLLEIGPQPILSATTLRAWPDDRDAPRAIASLRREVSDTRQMVEALAQLYVAGSRPDFRSFDRPWPRRPLDLPRYPFQHRHFWFEPSASSASTRQTTAVMQPATPAADAPADLAAAAPAPSPAPTPFVAEADAWLSAVEAGQREARITQFLRTELGRALRVEPAQIDPDAPFASLGIDSLTATELRNRVQAALGVPVPATTFVFTYPTLSSLARGLLTLWTERRADPRHRDQQIQRIARTGPMALSHAQEQLWFLDQLMPGSSLYNIAVRIRLRGTVDADTLASTIDAVVARHEVLRTTFRSEAGTPHAIVAETLHVDLPVHDLTDPAEVEVWARRDAGTPLDLAVGPLFRVRLLRLATDDHVLLVTMHHIVTDAWSFRVFFQDLAESYGAMRLGQPSPLGPLPMQYADYAAWQREWLQGKALGPLLEYWQQALAGAPQLELPTDRPRPLTPSLRGARVRFELGRARVQALRALCAEEQVTLFVPVMSAFAVLLQRYSGQDDFVVGTLSANRTRLELENLIGFFVNAVPVRIRLDGDLDIRSLLGRVRAQMLEVMAHQEAPFDLIVNTVAQERDAGRNPLFQVQLVLQAAVTTAALPGLEVEVTEIDTNTAKRDLTLTLFDDETLSGHLEYAADLFDAVRIERLIGHFEMLVDAIAGDRGQRLSSLTLLTEAERVLHAKRPGRTGVHSIQQLFERTADRFPCSVAVVSGTRSMTYRELDAAASRLAQSLRRRGIAPGATVALRVGRSLEMVVGFLGILKAGGIYVPIDPSYPADRMAHMVADAGASWQLEVVDDAGIASESGERLASERGGDDPAYIIYTSGSTGRPKGVIVSHHSVVEYADTLGRELGIGLTDVYLHTASISFSSSIRQLVVPLAAGATMVIADEDERRDPLALLARIRASQVTVADLVPTVVRQMVDAVSALPSGDRGAALENRLRLLLTASEPLRFGLVQDWRTHLGPTAAWINMYGQTETTGIVSLYPVPDSTTDRPRQAIVPIGRPRGNVAMPVLDRQMRPVPRGVVGDLYVGGEALALGYTGEPRLTDERFLTNPLGDGERLYAAGDAVRLAWDGTIEFVGRTDQQLKIRGLRVEPAEIERVLLEYPDVREAMVLGSDDGAEGLRLVAYLATAGAPVSLAGLRAHARVTLPEHMVPAAWVVLDRLPRTANGKVDRSALPAPERAQVGEVEYLAPRPGMEEALAGIWRSVLRVEQVGAGDNFFSLGGHSLLAAQLRSRIRSTLGVDVPLAAIFEDQTLAALAARLDDAARPDRARILPPLVPIARDRPLPASYAQELMWQQEQAQPGSPGHWIDVGLRIRGPLDVPRLIRSVHEAIERHEPLRTTFRPVNGFLGQVILDAWEPDLRLVEANGETPNGNAAAGPVDVSQRPPIRAELVRAAEDDHTLKVFAHRILCDGFATRLLLGEIGSLYENSITGTGDMPLLSAALQYADYAAWERAWLAGTTLTRQVEFFRTALTGATEALILPTDHPRPARRLHRGARHPFEFPRAISDLARAVAAREGGSLYTVLLAAFASALAQYAGRPEVVVGSPVSRRTYAGTEQMIGPFINIVPVRIRHADNGRLPALVGQVKEALLPALAHQDAPFHLVTSALRAEHGAAADGAGEVAFVMGDPAPRELIMGDLALTRVDTGPIVARRELTLTFVAVKGDITGTMTYDRDLFEAGTIAGMMANFEAALASAGNLVE